MLGERVVLSGVCCVLGAWCRWRTLRVELGMHDVQVELSGVIVCAVQLAEAECSGGDAGTGGDACCVVIRVELRCVWGAGCSWRTQRVVLGVGDACRVDLCWQGGVSN